MPKKRTPKIKKEMESSDLQPKPVPMPEQPSKSTPTEAPVMPMPTPMPMPGPDASSLANPASPSSETPRVIPMADYRTGRGGMRMVPMGAGEPPAQSTDRSQGRVEGRPPATKMPSA